MKLTTNSTFWSMYCLAVKSWNRRMYVYKETRIRNISGVEENGMINTKLVLCFGVYIILTWTAAKLIVWDRQNSWQYNSWTELLFSLGEVFWSLIVLFFSLLNEMTRTSPASLKKITAVFNFDLWTITSSKWYIKLVQKDDCTFRV